MSVQSDCAAIGLGVNVAGTACAQPVAGSSAAPGFVPAPYTGGTALPANFTDQLTQKVQGPDIGSAPGQCPMLPDGSCSYGGGSVSCQEFRECDPYTAENHVEYTLPGGAAVNANVWSVDSSGNLVWLGANGQPQTPPSYASPPYLDKGVFTSQYNPTTQAKLSSAGVVGADYNPSSGWTPSAGLAPVETSPSGTAFQNSQPTAKSSAQQKTTPTNTNPSTTKYAAYGAAGAPGTSGVKTPSTSKPLDHTMLLIVVAIAIILLSRA